MTGRFRYFSRALKGSAEEVNAALEWIRDLAEQYGMAEGPRSRLELCADEVLANVAEHAYKGGTGAIDLGLFLDRDTATLTVVDDGPPFDPRSHPLPPLPDSLATARIGGLGLRLVREFGDSVLYEHVAGRNRVSVRIGARTLVRGEERRQALAEPTYPLERADGECIAADARQSGERRVGHLSETSLFRGVDSAVIDSIVRHCEFRTCEPDEILFRAGDYHRCVLVILEGHLRVHLDDPASNFQLELKPGESAGELSVADGKPVSAWIVASEPTRLLVIPEPVFLEKVLAIPRISRNLVSLMAERTRRSDAHILARVRAAMELEALQRELDFARQIQSSMLPVAPLFAGNPAIRGRGFMRAARHVGGDFYDAFPLSDGRIFAAIGDVCNKGTPAALFMVRTLTVLRSEAMRVDDDPAVHLARLADRCNELLNESNDAQQFVTLFCVIVDLDQGTVHYVNAGHNPPLLRTAGAPPVFLDQPRNPIAGVLPGLVYAVGRCDFPPKSMLLLYTDGVTEAQNSAGAMFEDEALRELAARDDVLDVDACVEAIVAAVDGFAGDQPQADDITLLALQRP